VVFLPGRHSLKIRPYKFQARGEEENPGQKRKSELSETSSPTKLESYQCNITPAKNQPRPPIWPYLKLEAVCAQTEEKKRKKVLELQELEKPPQGESEGRR